MTKKKRTFFVVYKEISNLCGKSKPVSAELWAEAHSLAKTFRDFTNGHSFARHDDPKWGEKFLDGMAKTAEKPAEWEWVCNSSAPLSGHWSLGVSKLLEIAEQKNSLPVWKKVRAILPKDHKLSPEIRAKISEHGKKHQTANEA